MKELRSFEQQEAAIILYQIESGKIDAEKLQKVTFNLLAWVFFERGCRVYKPTYQSRLFYTIRKHFIDHFRPVPIRELTMADFMEFREQLIKSDYQDKNLIMSLFYLIMDLAEPLLGYRDKSYKLVPKIKEHKPDDSIKKMMKNREQTWKLKDFERFISFLKNDKYKLLFILAYVFGLRLGETLAIKTSDIIDDKLLIYQSASNQTYGHVGTRILSTKSKSSNRILVLPEFLQTYIRKYIRKHRLENDVPLFQGRNGNYLTRNPVQTMLKNTTRKAGVPYLNFHKFRHSEASLLAQAGFSTMKIQKLLGHSSTDITDRIYIHSSEEDKREVANYQNEIFKSVFL